MLYIDRISGNSGIQQYRNYIDSQIYLGDLKKSTNDITNYNLIEIRRCLGETSMTNKENYKSLVNVVCGNLDRNFNGLNRQLSGIQQLLGDANDTLDAINSNINDLYAMLDYKIDLIVDELKTTNYVLKIISNKLDRPQSLINNEYCVKKGLGYLSVALEEGIHSDCYMYALTEFMKAVGFEYDDYFSLFKLGLIHLNSYRHLNLPLADEYFKKAISFAKAAYKIEKNNKKQWILDIIAFSYYHSSKCNYVIGNIKESIKQAFEAATTYQHNPVFQYQLAKCLSINNQLKESAAVLVNVIALNPNFFVTALTDKDFITKDFIVQELMRKSGAIIAEANNEFKRLSPLITPRSKFYILLSQLNRQYTFTNYLLAIKALDEMRLNREFTYIRHSGISWIFTHNATINANLYEILKIERDEENHAKERDQYLTKMTEIREKKQLALRIFQTVSCIILILTILFLLNGGNYSFAKIVSVFVLVLLLIYMIFQFHKEFKI